MALTGATWPFRVAPNFTEIPGGREISRRRLSYDMGQSSFRWLRHMGRQGGKEREEGQKKKNILNFTDAIGSPYSTRE